MTYICVPPTIAKARDEIKLYRVRLQQWKSELEKYPKVCPQLSGPIAEIQLLLKVLEHSVQSQEELITQRIQLQTALDFPELTVAPLPTTVIVPSDIQSKLSIPIITNKTPPTKTRLLIRPKEWAALSPVTYDSSKATQYHKYSGTKSPPSIVHESFDSHPFSTRLSSQSPPILGYGKPFPPTTQHSTLTIQLPPPNSVCKTQRRSTLLLQDSNTWKPIPSHLKAFPSIVEQLINQQQPKLSSIEWNNRFLPLFLEYSESMDEPEIQMAEAPSQQHTSEPGVNANDTEASPLATSGPIDYSNKLTIDMLRQFVPVSTLDPAVVEDSPQTYASAIRVAPRGFEKVRLDCNIGRSPKDSTKVDKILALFNVAKQFDKHVCICPTGTEAHPPLYSAYDIKKSRIYHYFQDKPGAQKNKNSNNLYGYIVFGVTTDVDDFVMAIKDWAANNRHEVTRHGVPSSSVIAGFIIHTSLTLNRDDATLAIRASPEWQSAGCPEFSIKVSPIWSSGGVEAKVPAMCCECERSKVAEFEKMCETLFYGENLSLPSSIREAYFFRSRLFAANDPVRLTYMAGQRDFLTTERTITCDGLANIYQVVSLRSNPTYTSTIEDLILLIQGTKGPLFRSVDRTVEDKVFLKLDVSNLGAWAIRKDQLGDHLRSLVHPEDHARVFLYESQELSFSEPWQKYKDGQLSKNVMKLPSKESLAYVDRYKEKFVTSGPQLPPLLKKRAHSNVSDSTVTTTASTTSPPVQSQLIRNVIDLTEPSYTVASPNHKVQVVEQRAFQDNPSPVSSMASSVTPAPLPTSPKTQRMQQLESRVESHDKKLTSIQNSVAALDDKIVTQSETTSFQFKRFEEMLGHIHGTIVSGMQKLAEPKPDQPAQVHVDNTDGMIDTDGAYNPNHRAAEWNETWRRDQAQRLFIATQRSEYVAQLQREAEHYGETFDFHAAAIERFPDPPQIDYPDDITYTDDL